MSVLYIALPIALLLGLGSLLACLHCIRAGQYDDLSTPPMRILIDELEDKSELQGRTTVVND